MGLRNAGKKDVRPVCRPKERWESEGAIGNSYPGGYTTGENRSREVLAVAEDKVRKEA